MHFVKAKGILSPSNGMNIYRGCVHGCIYCDSRSKCYQINHDFEDIEVKENAAELLEKALGGKKKKVMIGTGSMTDPYIPQEKQLELTRKIAEIVYNHGFGFTVITKSDLILRDLELLKKINGRSKCVVQMTLTTYDERLCRVLEPGVCTTKRRAEVLNILRDEGIPTVAWLCPILPFINDTEENIEGIIKYCVAAGVKGILCFGMGVTLRDGSRDYFFRQLDKNFPGMKNKYMREFGNAYMCPSPRNDRLMRLLYRRCDEAGIMRNNDEIFDYLHEMPNNDEGLQLEMF